MNGMKNKMNETGATDEDAGMMDNRLSLNPNEPAFRDVLAEWEDGGEYALTDLPEGTMLRQISPGEFEVMPPAEGEVAETEEEPVGAAQKRKPRNPAVANLISANT